MGYMGYIFGKNVRERRKIGIRALLKSEKSEFAVNKKPPVGGSEIRKIGIR